MINKYESNSREGDLLVKFCIYEIINKIDKCKILRKPLGFI